MSVASVERVSLQYKKDVAESVLCAILQMHGKRPLERANREDSNTNRFFRDGGLLISKSRSGTTIPKVHYSIFRLE